MNGAVDDWMALGMQLVKLTAESYRPISSGGIKCLHCGVCSASGVKDAAPLLIMHHEDCEVGKAQVLIDDIRKRHKKKR